MIHSMTDILITIFLELSDFHISRSIEILEIPEICKSETCGNT